MKIFVTGATGYIGQRLVLRLVADGHRISALIRDPLKAKKSLDHPNITCFTGDILNSGQLLNAMENCEAVYHLAALASVWHKDKNAFHEYNVTGLQNILECCLELKIQDLVFTSSAGVVGHSTNGQAVAEHTNAEPKLETAYEQSKVEAERLIKAYCEKGIRGIIVNPSRVYGPGLLTESNGVTRLAKMYVEGKWHILPGNGKSVGNYVFIDDVIDGHILAMEKARPGERYLLGGENASFIQFFTLLNQLAGKKHWLFKFPLSLMLLVSKGNLMLAELFGKQPLITPPFVRKYNKHWIISSAKAQEELGYHITPLREGLKRSLEWLKEYNNIDL